jgi:hypothetical protein
MPFQLQLLSEVRWGQILLDNCGGFTSTGPAREMDDSAGAGRKILSEEKDGAETVKRLRNPPPSPTLDCQVSAQQSCSVFPFLPLIQS